MTQAPDADPYSPSLALLLHFLLEAWQLGLLSPPLSDLVASWPEGKLGGVAPALRALTDSREPLGLPGLAVPSVPGDCDPSPLRLALARLPGEASPRAAASRLARFCEALLRGRRRATGSYYTPRWIADAAAATVVRGLLAGRRAPSSSLLSLRLLDPAVGGGAFAVAAVEAIAEAMGEGRSENDVRRAAARECIFGSDLDPLAAVACGLALWLNSSRPGRPALVPEGSIRVADALARPPPLGSFDAVVGNPPWGVKVSQETTHRLAAAAPDALSGHRDSFLFFLHLAAGVTRDDGALGLLLPDTILFQVRYQAMRQHLLARFRPLRIALLGEAIFPGATAPACLLCLAGRSIAPEQFPTSDLRRVSRPELEVAARHPGPPTPRDAPLTAPHQSFLLPPLWLQRLLSRLASAFPSLGGPQAGFTFHDVGINYPRADVGRQMLYPGVRQSPEDVPVTRGRDFGPFGAVGHSLWLRGDWRERVGEEQRVSVRDQVYRGVPKLLLRQTADRPVATIDRRGAWFGRSVIAITGPSEADLLRLLALLNSRAFAALYRSVAPEAGRSFAQVKVSKLTLLPVPPDDSGELARLASALLEEDDLSRRSALAGQLDAAAYRAYGLTEEEVERVEEMVGPCLPASPASASQPARRPRRAATS